MIRLHEFNTKWWGHPVGIVDDGAFFSLSPEAQQEALAPFHWVEYKAPLHEAPLLDMQRAGFFLSDVQEQFRIKLSCEEGSFLEPLNVCFADAKPLELTDESFAAFEHERFQHLPGCSKERLRSRYGPWARQMIREHPETCLAVLANGAIQGWFLSHPVSNGLNLALAMNHRDARISGFLVYQKGLSAYAARGYRIGGASFSVTNTAVHNIYCRLGAQFVAPTGIWLKIMR